MKAKTRSGLDVRILCTDRKSDHFPVVGLIMLPSGVELASDWTLDGFRHIGAKSQDDLVDFKIGGERHA